MIETLLQSTPSKPILLPDEIIHLSITKVGLYLENERLVKYDSGTLTCSSHRILWTDTSAGFQIPLQSLLELELAPGFMTTSSKLVLKVLRYSPSIGIEWVCSICDSSNEATAVKCVVCGVQKPPDIPSTALTGGCTVCTFINPKGQSTCQMCGVALALEAISLAPISLKLSFRNGSGSAVDAHKKLKESLEAKVWITKPVERVGQIAMGGVSGILKNVQENQTLISSSLGSAFSDLRALMDKASEMVKLAESITSKLNSYRDSPEMATFQSYLKDIGISAPVTKKTAGDSYTVELSRQLAEFLSVILVRDFNGLISLSDLYCLFNRARGVALVSPDDLFKACQEFESLKLSFRLKRFDSGLWTVTSESFGDDQVSLRILKEMMVYNDGISAVRLAKIEGISVLLARELLLVLYTKVSWLKRRVGFVVMRLFMVLSFTPTSLKRISLKNSRMYPSHNHESNSMANSMGIQDKKPR